MESRLETINSLTASGGFFTNAMALKAGIDRTMLKRYCDRGLIERIGRGRYAFQNQFIDEYALLQSSCAQGIYSYETALFFWGMTDRLPHIVEMTFPVGSNTTLFRRNNPHVQCHYVSQEIFSIGQTQTTSPQGGQVILYDRERCLCDIIRNRKRADMQAFSQSIRQYFSEKPNLRKLIKYSRLFGIEDKVRVYIEVMS